MDAIDWSTLAVIVAALQTGFIFLDTHHVSSKFKDRLRSVLIKAFLLLERFKLADIGNGAVNAIVAPAERLPVLRILLTSLVFAVASALAWITLGALMMATLSAGWAHPGNAGTPRVQAQGFGEIFLEVISDPFALVLLMYTVPITLAWVMGVRFIYRKMAGSPRLVLNRMAFVASMAVPTVLLYVALGFMFSDSDDNLFLFAIASPYIVFAFTVMAIYYIRLIILGLRALFMAILDRASSPTTSPFTYLGGILGVTAALLKLADAFL